jgi:hypothetical protein
MDDRILLIEGTCGTGKSTLQKGLLRKYAWEQDKPRTLLYLTQAHTYFPLMSEDLAQPPGKREHREHLRKIMNMLEWPLGALTPRRWFTLYALIDTLHLTHAFRPAILSWSEMSYIDQRLASLGTRMVFLQADPDTLWDRLIAERGKEPLYLTHFQKRFGSSPEAIHRYYIEEQEQLRALAEKSSLQTLFLQADDPLADNTAKAYAFWIQA